MFRKQTATSVSRNKFTKLLCLPLLGALPALQPLCGDQAGGAREKEHFGTPIASGPV